MPRTAQDIMNRELLAIRPDMPTEQARDLLLMFRVGAMPVLDDLRRPVGVISVRDLLHPGGTTGERMSRPAICVSTSTPIEDAARQLARSDIHHLVVVDGAGMAVGMLSTLDVLRALLDLPTRHPDTFPHWDELTGVSWTDDRPLEEESVRQAPEAAGVLALTTGHLGDRDTIVWVESCLSLRQRVRNLLTDTAREEARLRHILTLQGLRFRTAVVPDESARRCIVGLMRARIESVPPPGAT